MLSNHFTCQNQNYVVIKAKTSCVGMLRLISLLVLPLCFQLSTDCRDGPQQNDFSCHFITSFEHLTVMEFLLLFAPLLYRKKISLCNVERQFNARFCLFASFKLFNELCILSPSLSLKMMMICGNNHDL